ncbi:hypothetical protein SmJEL517_g01420 [Synchytrium microbalum]|uniref:Peptidase M20 domain-containing protein 2 n=1 Tax=Synchytrium microbalum TaxID=1806994 RepID=A0A507C9L0_9FUNG|nr:uncharacterized protein SmJEL517_g01420 [Synchytrium microbalum]TPX36292.1 hypothetical protein SmJEL517_g01420 [Synchytrium microbalum]
MVNVDMDKVHQVVADAIKAHSAELEDLSLQIHSKPELAFEEHFAHDLLTTYLQGQGFIVTKNACCLKTAFIAEYTPEKHHDKELLTIAFLSEYDALPVIGHACGHNLIAIVGIAAALGFKAAMDEFKIPARLRVYGTPAEEAAGGKINMIDYGAFKDVDVALMGHGGNKSIVYCNALAMQTIHVHYYGISAHGAAAPWEGINALDAIVTAYTSISNLRQQTLPTNRIHGVIHEGGAAPNVIPNYTRGEWYIRAKYRDDLEALRPRVLACFEAGAKATGCTYKVEIEEPFYDIKANDALCQMYTKYAEREGVVMSSKEVQLASLLGSTDMGNVTYVVPGIHPIFDIGCTSNIHTESFREHAKTPEAHEAALKCSRILSMTALECIADPVALANVRKDFGNK